MKLRSKKHMLCSMLIALFIVTDAVYAETQVKVGRVTEFAMQPQVKISGTLHSRNVLAINAGIDGQLDWVAEPGMEIKQGEDIVRFNAQRLLLEKQEQEAIIKQTERQLTYLDRELKRVEILKRTSNASVDQFEQIQSRRDLARGDLEIAKVKVEQIKERLERTKIKAPFTGTVTERLQRGSEEVNRKDLLARFLDTKNLELRIFVPVKYYSQVAVGDVLQMQSSDSTSTAERLLFEGKVRVIVPSTDARSQTFEIRIDVPDKATWFWTPGQLVDAAIPLKNQNNILAVPRDALLLRGDGTYVVLIDKENKAHRIKVTVGDGRDQWVSVSGALAIGDRVAIRGAERLKEGDAVIIKEPAV